MVAASGTLPVSEHIRVQLELSARDNMALFKQEARNI